MVRGTGRKALEGLREGVDGAWDGSLGRLGLRNPLPRRRVEPLGPSPGLAVFLVVLSVLALAAAVLYRRKRRQVAEHYNMGGTHGVREGENAPGVEASAPRA